MSHEREIMKQQKIKKKVKRVHVKQILTKARKDIKVIANKRGREHKTDNIKKHGAHSEDRSPPFSYN